MNMLAVGVLATDSLMSIGQEIFETKNLLLAVYFASLEEKQKQDTVSLPSQKVRLLNCPPCILIPTVTEASWMEF